MEWDQSVLFLEYPSNHSFPHRFAVPGGKVEPGESPEEALERELNEELSLEKLDWSSITFVQYAFVRSPKANYRLHLFKWKLKSPISIQLDEAEHLSYVWQPLAQVSSVNLIDGQLSAFNIVYPGEI